VVAYAVIETKPTSFISSISQTDLYARYDNVVVVVRFVGLVRRKKELNELSKAEMLVATSFFSDRFSVISLSTRMRNCFVFGTKRVLLIL